MAERRRKSIFLVLDWGHVIFFLSEACQETNYTLAPEEVCPRGENRMVTCISHSLAHVTVRFLIKLINWHSASRAIPAHTYTSRLPRLAPDIATSCCIPKCMLVHFPKEAIVIQNEEKGLYGKSIFHCLSMLRNIVTCILCNKLTLINPFWNNWCFQILVCSLNS